MFRNYENNICIFSTDLLCSVERTRMETTDHRRTTQCFQNGSHDRAFQSGGYLGPRVPQRANDRNVHQWHQHGHGRGESNRKPTSDSGRGLSLPDRLHGYLLRNLRSRLLQRHQRSDRQLSGRVQYLSVQQERGKLRNQQIRSYQVPLPAGLYRTILPRK